MKILQVNVSYAPAWGHGGPPRVLFDYARELVKKGHQVTVFTTDSLDAGRVEASHRTLDGVEVWYFRNLSNWLAWRKRRYLAFGLWWALLTRLQEFDVVHLGECRSHTHALMSVLLRWNSVPLVHSAFGSLPRRKNGVKTIYDYFFTKPLLKRAAALLAQTRHEAEEYLQYGAPPDRVKLLLLPVEAPHSARQAGPDAFRKQLRVSSDAIVVLFLGRFHRTKNVPGLIRIFAQAAREDARLHMVIVGRDDGHTAEIHSAIATNGMDQRITVLGPQYGEERFRTYAASDLFIFRAAVYEETSLASLEALASGTPALVSDRSEVPGLEEYRAGWMLPPDDEREWVHRILAFASMPVAERAAMGENARRLIAERFSPRAVAQELEGVLRGAMATR